MEALAAGVLAIFVAVVGAQNEEKQSFYKCPPNTSIDSIIGVAVSHQVNRVWDFTCSKTPIGTSSNCMWEDYSIPDRDVPSVSLCQNQGYVAGVSRKVGTTDIDGQITILCCESPIHFMHGCVFTPWLNEKITQTFNYKVPEGMALRGILSFYDYVHRARRYRFEVCKIGNFLKI